MFVVLAFHSIHPQNNYKYSITPKRFEEILKALSRTHEVISVPQLIDKIIQGQKGRYAAITFDDGYADNFEYAWPILKKFNMPATIFLPTAYIDATFNEQRTLTWEQATGLATSGLIDFGSHTHTHYLLNDGTEDVIRREYEQSQKIIESKLGKPARFLAMPKGKSSPLAETIAKDYFEAAFSQEGVMSFDFDLFHLPRITISPKISPLKFRLLLNSWYWKLKKIKSFYD